MTAQPPNPSCDLLIVEDDPTQAEELACFLGRAGLRVRTARTGSQALHSVWTLQPRVALIDYNLPDMDGVTVAERVKRLSPGTAMIMMSGRIDGLSEHTLEKFGVFAFMSKPVQLSPLRQSVNRLIRATKRTGLPPVAPKKGFFALAFGAGRTQYSPV